MNRRIPLLVAVVGALLVGGATTGTTRASWVDQADVSSSAISSGVMGLSGSAASGSLAVQRGSSVNTLVTVTDTSSAAAKNLRQRMTPSLTGSLPTGVTATLTTSNGSNCGSASQGASDLAPGGSTVMCLTVAASSSSTATSTTVTVSYAGAQVRGGTVAGWTTAAKTVSIPVTISSPAPAAPDLSCAGSYQSNGNWYTLISWSEVAGATSYRVYRSTTSASSGYSAALNTTQRWAIVQMDPNDNMYLRVTTLDDGAESAPSNVLRLRRSGNAAPTCQDLG